MPRSPRMGESGALGNRHRYSARQENPSGDQISSSIATGAISGLAVTTGLALELRQQKKSIGTYLTSNVEPLCAI